MSPPLIRCTRRVRHSLNHLIMQPTDLDQVTTSIRTRNALLLTWYLPLHNLQHCLHRRYEAEQMGECILPKGVAPPLPRALAPTEHERGTHAAARAGPRAHPHLTSYDTPSSDTATHANPLYNELNNRTLASGECCVPLGYVTLLVGDNYPATQSRLERWLDPAPHTTLSVRVAVMDRISWQRTSWLAGSICHSLCWGRLPQYVYAIPIDYRHRVTLTGDASLNGAIDFDETTSRYVTPLRVEVPGLGFRLTVEDGGVTLFDPRTTIVDGFLDNESALHRLALAREVNMLGLGGSVYRQTLWCTPCMPNVGKVVQCDYGQLFERYFGCNPIGDPVAVWLIRDVPQTLLYQMEGEVEDENEPNSATTYGDRSLTERVQKKAMNRYNNFRDELRGKVYSELEGRELPR